ncbi:hypothetical protein Sn110110_023 [Cyanophage S-RIM14]|uniref:Uncharacterized protein n=1 Tax=Cyanophage S-RIM14 TaxID=1278423 RepID=A0A1D7SKU6_9CAUD|nr:hypothetical protein Sn110110_023 [Cyanophage S-RIM14]
MTIEGRPEMETWQTQYAVQRKDRMGDAIGDYLNDDKVEARQAYEEMLSEAIDWRDYHQKQLTKAQQFLDLIHPNRGESLSNLDFLD